MRIKIILCRGLLAGALAAPSMPAVAQQPSPPPAAAPAAAPSSAVTLKITAKGSGIPITKAEVDVGGERLYSDASGTVVIPSLPAGDGDVRVLRKGFLTLTVPLRELRPPGEYDVRLYPGQPDDDTILVQGKRKSSISRKTVSIEEAAKVAPGGDAAQVVKLLPGVHEAGGGRGGGGGQVVVQGSGPHDSRYFIDDLEVPLIFHSIGNLSVIPGDMLSSVDFESAGFGAEYGDATGGIITLHTKDDIPERAKTSFVVNVPFYSGVLYQAPLSETSSITVGVRRSYVDYFLRAYLSERNKHSSDPSTAVTLSPYFSDGQVQYLKKDDDGHTKVTLLGAYDGVKAVVPGDIGPGGGASGLSNINFYTGFADLGVERAQRLDKDWKYVSTPQIYAQKIAVTFNTLDALSTTEKVRVPTEFTRRLGKGESLYLGLDPDYTVATTRVDAPRFQPDDPTFDPQDAPSVQTNDVERYATLATWAAVDHVIGAATITPGVRASYNGQIKKTATDPRLRARYALNDEHTLKAAVGQYSESPQPLEASPERGNPDLDFIKSYHYVLGVETKWSEAWSTDVSVYYKTAKSVVESDAQQNYVNKGSLRSRGFETMIRRNATGRLFGWLSYTYSRTEDRPSDDAAWRTATYDQTHVLTLVGDYKFTGTWDVGGRYDYHTGSTYDTVESSVFNANLDKYEARPTSSDINNGRLPPSNALTVYFNHDFLYDTWKLAMRFGVERYWFQPQTDEISYNYNYAKTEEARSIQTIPFFELKGEL